LDSWGYLFDDDYDQEILEDESYLGLGQYGIVEPISEEIQNQ
jgi:hypothetical protein